MRNDFIQAVANGRVAQFQMFGHLFEAAAVAHKSQYELLIVFAEADQLRKAEEPFHPGLAGRAFQGFYLQLGAARGAVNGDFLLHGHGMIE